MKPALAVFVAVSAAAVATGAAGAAAAQGQPPAAQAPGDPAAAGEAESGSAEATAAADATAAAPAAAGDAVVVTGFIDVGFAKAQGDGTSFAPGDRRVPADYGVDPFAPAVNSRGDVASADPGGRFVNGFLPRSAGIGGHSSFLLNALDADLRYTSRALPLFVFARAVLLPRLSDAGDATEVLLEQAFGRFTPFDFAELTISVGKFDSVFGIEYLENPSNIRVGITPSLFARYTTGTSIGAKVFGRVQLPALWSALTVNAAGTNSGNMIEALQGPDASLTGIPVASIRLGYELNLPRLEIKLGASGLQGPRNDQRDPDARQRMLGVDARLVVAGLALNGEYMRVDEEAGTVPKLTGAGLFAMSSGFHARGFHAQATYGIPLPLPALKRVSVYARVEQRHAWFEGFVPITVRRGTFGLRLDLGDQVALKGEVLINREVEGAPEVANNVTTGSLVYTW